MGRAFSKEEFQDLITHLSEKDLTSEDREKMETFFYQVGYNEKIEEIVSA